MNKGEKGESPIAWAFVHIAFWRGILWRLLNPAVPSGWGVAGEQDSFAPLGDDTQLPGAGGKTVL